MKKILITTGGSGGHVMPALNLYEHLRKEYNVKIYTDIRGAKYFPKEIDKTIFDVKQFSGKYLFPLKLLFLFIALIKSVFHFKKNNFDFVFSTGGYMSLPLVLAAKIFASTTSPTYTRSLVCVPSPSDLSGLPNIVL